MTDVQLATLSTLAWLVAMVTLLILLAGWSTGTSWGLTASIVRGVRGWSDRDDQRSLPVSPGAEDLPPIIHRALDRRPEPMVTAELVDLGNRRLSDR